MSDIQQHDPGGRAETGIGAGMAPIETPHGAREPISFVEKYRIRMGAAEVVVLRRIIELEMSDTEVIRARVLLSMIAIGPRAAEIALAHGLDAAAVRNIAQHAKKKGVYAAAKGGKPIRSD